MRARTETDRLSSPSGLLAELAVVAGATVATEHSVVTLTETSVGAGRLRTGRGPPPVLRQVPLQPHRQVEILVVVPVLLAWLVRLVRLVPHKLILLLHLGLSAEEALVGEEIEAGPSPGSEAEEESEEEEGPHHTQSWPSLHSQCFRDGLEVFRGNISGDDDVTVGHTQERQRVRTGHLTGHGARGGC